VWPFGLRKSPETAAAPAAEEQRALTSDLLELFGLPASAAGVHVTPTSALRCTAVRCAALAIAETVGQLPAHVFERGTDGSRERAPDHPAYGLLHNRSNPWTSAGSLRERITLDALLHDRGGFGLIVRAGGRIAELHRLDPNAVTVEADDLTGEPLYRIRQNGRPDRVHGFADVLHLQAPGGAPITQAREAIGLALILEQHASKLFANGARPGGVLRFPNKLGAEVAKRIKASWQAAFGGSNSGGTAVLEEGGEYQQLAFKSTDAQFLELRQFAIAEIARAFRVPPILLMDYGRATWSNSEEAARQFLTFSLMPWLQRWEGEFAKLFTEEERPRYFAAFETNSFARADLKSRAEAYSKLIAARVMTPNEARARENLPAHPDGDSLANPNITPAPGGSEA